MQQNLALNLNTLRARVTPNVDLSQVRNVEDHLAFKCDNSFILQGEDVKYCVNNACMCKNNSYNEIGFQNVGQKVPQFIPNVPVCLENSSKSTIGSVIQESLLHKFLVQDPCGNYVITHVIEMKMPSVSAKLISRFKGNYVYLLMQKLSSHVVESCLKLVAESTTRIFHELLYASHFEQLLQDPYANYVGQRALGVTKFQEEG